MSKRLIHSMILMAALVGALALTGCNTAAQTPAATASVEAPAAEAPAAEAPATQTGTPTADVTELKVKEIKVGTGTQAKAGDTVSVHYTGWLTDGTKFDSSKDAGQPFEFQLGQGMVIKGWDVGVAGMKVGGVRKLTIPADMGYGEQGAGGVIPPGATLVFEVELLAVK